jgi:hypothetical protein
MCPCRDAHRRLDFGKDAVRRNLWDGAAHPEGPLWLPIKLTLPEFESLYFLFCFLEEYNKGGRRQEVAGVLRDVSNGEGHDNISERRSAVRILAQGEQVLRAPTVSMGCGEGRNLCQTLKDIIGCDGYLRALTSRGDPGAVETA